MSSANSPAMDIKDFLEDSSSGLDLIFGTDLFIAEAPEQPDQLVCLYDTPGGPQEKFGLEYPGLQVFVRSNIYSDGYNLSRDIKYLLHHKENFIINSKYQIIAGCDKNFQTCKNKFNNKDNFRGEPYIEID